MAKIGELFYELFAKDNVSKTLDKIEERLKNLSATIEIKVDKSSSEDIAKLADGQEKLKKSIDSANTSKDESIDKDKESAKIEKQRASMLKQLHNLSEKAEREILKMSNKQGEGYESARRRLNEYKNDIKRLEQEVGSSKNPSLVSLSSVDNNAFQKSKILNQLDIEEQKRLDKEKGISSEYGNQIRLLRDMKNQISSVFSLYGIERFLQNVVEIGGKLEQDKIAMGAVLQDAGKAEVMYSKIAALAIKSPFGVMELTNYSKQLSAYGIQYNELYDTMKRLADISAGVGVDMGRLILAYGQVRAAKFLKGTELRQFTEANVPMVDKLAERFTKLQGRIVSAGEVLDMISKKQVKFEDVKAVLWELTGEGGMFNNMQEVMSESVAAKWKNLGDAIDLMYAKMAQMTSGPLKAIPEILQSIITKFEYLIPLVVTFGGKSLLTKIGAKIKSVNKEMSTSVFVIKSIWNALKTLFVSNIGALALAGILEVITYFRKRAQDIKELNDEVAKSADGSVKSLKSALGQFADIDLKTASETTLKTAVDSMITTIKNESVDWARELEGVLATNPDGSFVLSLQERYTELKRIMEETLEVKKTIDANPNAVGDIMNAGNWKWTDGIINFKEGFVDNGNDYINSLQKLRKSFSLTQTEAEAFEGIVQSVRELYSDNGEGLLGGKNTIFDQLMALTTEGGYKDLTKMTDNASLRRKLMDFYERLNTDVADSMSDLRANINPMVKALNEYLVNSIGLLDENGDINEKGKKVARTIIDAIVNSLADDETGRRDIHKEFSRLLGFDTSTKSGSDDGSGAVGEDYSKDKNDHWLEAIKERVNNLKKAYSEYKKLAEQIGKDEAARKLNESGIFGALFSGNAPMNSDDYLRLMGDIKKDMEGKLTSKERRNENNNIILEMLGIESDQMKEQIDKSLQDTTSYLKKLTDKWDVYKKALDATGDKGIASNLAFGGVVSYESVVDELRDRISKYAEDNKIGIMFENLIGMSEQNLRDSGFGDSIIKPLISMIEKYNDEVGKLNKDTADNFLEMLKNSRSFEGKMAEIQRKYEEDIGILNANVGGLPASQISNLMNQRTERYNKDMANVRFDQFKQSSGWQRIFEDLDRVAVKDLEGLIRKIEGFLSDNPDMDATDMRSIMNSLRQARSNVISRTPFQSLFSSVGAIGRAGMKKYGKDSMVTDDMLTDFEESLKASVDAVDSFVSSMSTISDMFSKLGVDMSGLDNALSVMSGMANGASAGAGLFETAGSLFGEGSKLGGMLSSLGPYGAAAGAALGIVSSLAEVHDKKLNAAIEESVKRVTKLKNEYENIERIVERQLDQITRKQTKDMVRNLSMQRDEIRLQMELESQKKKSDDSKIADYKKQIAELDDQLKYFYDDLAEDRYGASLKSWSEKLASALTDAFAKGEDAALAFDNTVNEIMKDMVEGMIRTSVIAPAIETLRENLFGHNGIFTADSENGADLSENEVVNLGQWLKNLEGTIDLSKDVYDRIDDSLQELGIDMGGSSSDSSLGKSIQGVTEDTANLLGSYMNSIRANTSMIQVLTERMVNDEIPQINGLMEAQLQNLSQIADNTKRNADIANDILSQINSVISGHQRLHIQ